MSSLQTFFGLLPLLLSGALTALEIALCTLVLASIGGLALAVWLTFSRSRLVQAGIACFIEWMRNVPALAHLFLIYFGLSYLGINLPAWLAAIVGLSLVGSAVLCDIFRAGLQSLHVGQYEAGLAVGLTRMQILANILLPQSLRRSLPAFANYVTQLIKDTSIASAIAVPEIMFLARNLVTSTFQTSLIYFAVMCIYAAMILPIGLGFIRLERHWGSAR
ncbi:MULTISPECIES: amino acid ABC transporter permease [Pseudomonas]|uniref:Amino acid ABC transporter permease n=1 Tax=Pseudomonas gingeri TaxID=117681 RepID=A0A7Y7WLR4_9PSED|nr:MULTISPECIES: amino acid ABC transporter permease [Pseudomonas]MPQ71574.1 ABC transporter permease subunit [Pseudomonas sp. MWU12-2323]NWB83759.1 amino acid ABC transporter permease [Pseudomonas gingeri]RBH52296.1 amino acid ABC transporter permease [Pseudomonas sp. MWU13-2860]